MVISNVLAERYATQPSKDIWSEEGRVVKERELWIAVMKAQARLGLNIPSEVIEKYERAKDEIDLESINEIERRIRHDIKARIEEFNRVAGIGANEQHVHKGMTSRDLSDNVEQMQILQSSELIFGRHISVLRHISDRASEYENTVIVGRSHHQPAQPITLGKRMSMWEQEQLLHLEAFRHFIDNYPLRGMKGAMGTQADMLDLLKDGSRVDALEEMVAEHLGFSNVLDSTGQIYPRSLDLGLASRLVELSSASSNYAITMRLMAGYDLVTEGFKQGQVGSSAMPHKMNTRSSERINGLNAILKGYQTMLGALAGNQWEEGDVSCSVVRRVAIPDMFFASDGLCETTLTVLNEMGIYSPVIKNELGKYLQFMESTRLLMRATQSGIGREQAHEVIKRYCVEEALAMREDGKEPRVVERLAEDPLFRDAGITREDLYKFLEDVSVGRSHNQVDRVSSKTNELLTTYAEAARYEPGEIL